MNSKDSERIYHIERKVDEILELLKKHPMIFPGISFPSMPAPMIDPPTYSPNLICDASIPVEHGKYDIQTKLPIN